MNVTGTFRDDAMLRQITLITESVLINKVDEGKIDRDGDLVPWGQFSCFTSRFTSCVFQIN